MAEDSIEVKVARLEERMETIGGQVTVIGTDVREVRDTLLRQRGFIAAVSAVWAVVAAAGLAFWNHVVSGWSS